jgi:hypothetical protein
LSTLPPNKLTVAARLPPAWHQSLDCACVAAVVTQRPACCCDDLMLYTATYFEASSFFAFQLLPSLKRMGCGFLRPLAAFSLCEHFLCILDAPRRLQCRNEAHNCQEFESSWTAARCKQQCRECWGSCWAAVCCCQSTQRQSHTQDSSRIGWQHSRQPAKPP